MTNSNLVNVSRVAAPGHSSHRGQVAAVAAHHFDDEEPTLGSGRRLPDPVADFGDLVEGGVAAEREVRARNVVADGGGQHDHRDLELGVLGSTLGQQERGMVGLKPTDHQQSVNVLLSQLLRHLFVLPGRKGSLRAELCSAGVSPSVDGFPSQRMDVAGLEALDSVADPERIVTGDDAVSDKRPDGWNEQSRLLRSAVLVLE